MTTIALSADAVAVDSQITTGDTKNMHGKKLQVVQSPVGKVAVLVTGEISYLPPVCAQVALGKLPLRIVPEETAILLVGRTWAFWVDHKEHFPTLAPDAGGSGQPVARYLLGQGRTAQEAVQGAAEVDLYTGGKVVSVSRRGLAKGLLVAP